MLKLFEQYIFCLSLKKKTQYLMLLSFSKNNLWKLNIFSFSNNNIIRNCYLPLINNQWKRRQSYCHKYGCVNKWLTNNRKSDATVACLHTYWCLKSRSQTKNSFVCDGKNKEWYCFSGTEKKARTVSPDVNLWLTSFYIAVVKLICRKINSIPLVHLTAAFHTGKIRHRKKLKKFVGKKLG